MKNYQTEGVLEAGVDEAGRGPAFGRIYAAAVIWPPDVDSPLVRDSKTIKEGDMKLAYDFVRDHALDFSVAYATEEEIDRINVGQADMLAMHRALDGLKLVPEHVLVDGNYFEIYCRDCEPINFSTVVKGDSHYRSIAAASILAKWSRDNYVGQLCDEYPDLDVRYGLRSNKGYLAPRHKEGIATYGISQFHRSSWRPCKEAPLRPVVSLNDLEEAEEVYEVPTVPVPVPVPVPHRPKISVQVRVRL